MKTEKQYLRDEKRVITQLVKDLLSCGYSLTIHTDQDDFDRELLIKNSSNKNELLNAILNREKPVQIICNDDKDVFVNVAIPPYPFIIESYSNGLESKIAKTLKLTEVIK